MNDKGSVKVRGNTSRHDQVRAQRGSQPVRSNEEQAEAVKQNGDKRVGRREISRGLAPKQPPSQKNRWLPPAPFSQYHLGPSPETGLAPTDDNRLALLPQRGERQPTRDSIPHIHSRDGVPDADVVVSPAGGKQPVWRAVGGKHRLLVVPGNLEHRHTHCCRFYYFLMLVRRLL